jgi:hypothetical protein
MALFYMGKATGLASSQGRRGNRPPAGVFLTGKVVAVISMPATAGFGLRAQKNPVTD